MPSTRRLRNPRWVALLVSAFGVAVLVVAWTTRRGQDGQFPDTLLSAVGLLLTALVFVLGLAAGRLQRTADAAAEEARRLDELFLTAHLEHPEAVTTLDLWQRAGAMKEALFDGTGEQWSHRERQLVLREARRPVGNWGLVGSFDRAVEIGRIDSQLELAPDDPGHPLSRRRKSLERERARLVRQDNETREAAARAGVTVHGFRRLRARVQVAELSVAFLVSTARVFSVLMLGLVLLGSIYAGWGPNRAPTPEFWVAVVLIALALTYSRIVRDDINLEVAGLASALRDSPLLVLNEAERTLGTLWRAVSERSSRRVHFEKCVEDQVDQVAQRMPGIPWLASVRGRLFLIRAIDAADSCGPTRDLNRTRHTRDLRASMRPAARLLGFAVTRQDDPIAALAYARLLVLQAQVLERQLVDDKLDYFHSDDPAHLHLLARRHVARALTLMVDLPIHSDHLLSMTHRYWIKDQPYLWPEEGPLLQELKCVNLIEDGDR